MHLFFGTDMLLAFRAKPGVSSIQGLGFFKNSEAVVNRVPVLFDSDDILDRLNVKLVLINLVQLLNLHPLWDTVKNHLKPKIFHIIVVLCQQILDGQS